jgi:hypothetical protein
MKSSICRLAFALAVIAAGSLGAQERNTNVTQGPEAVFDRPVTEIVPTLESATASGVNGRVGNELVFWGYELADGRPVYFFACMKSADVDCAQRIESICTTTTTVLESTETNGKIVRRTCREVTTAAPGDTRPGCSDKVEDVALAVGLVSCG